MERSVPPLVNYGDRHHEVTQDTFNLPYGELAVTG